MDPTPQAGRVVVRVLFNHLRRSPIDPVLRQDPEVDNALDAFNNAIDKYTLPGVPNTAAVVHELQSVGVGTSLITVLTGDPKLPPTLPFVRALGITSDIERMAQAVFGGLAS